MDNLTHSLVGALLGQAGLKRRTGFAMPALVIGANLPDIDAGCVVYGLESLAMRRGLTHGPIAWFVLPLLLAGFLCWFDRWQASRGTRPDQRPPLRFGWLYALAFAACLTHPGLDWLNSYGIRLLEPFSSRWFYGDALFIADVWLWVLLGPALWLSLRRERRAQPRWRRPAWWALGLSLAYMGLNLAISRLALDMARMTEPYPTIAIANPVPFQFWRRDQLFVGADGRWFRRNWRVGNNYDLSVPMARDDVCRVPSSAHVGRADYAAFRFWSRAPFAEKASGGSVIVRDARFTASGTRDRFAVTLPGVRCQEPARL